MLTARTPVRNWLARLIIAPAVVVALPLLQPAAAQQSRHQINPAERAEQTWTQEDACTAGSFAQFPDLDLASLRQRDRYVDSCLKEHGLPPRAHLAPDP